MKTPDEIKKGLECERCSECPYDSIDDPVRTCGLEVDHDALAYIQQLESRLAQVERERDAAVNAIRGATKLWNELRRWPNELLPRMRP